MPCAQTLGVGLVVRALRSDRSSAGVSACVVERLPPACGTRARASHDFGLRTSASRIHFEHPATAARQRDRPFSLPARLGEVTI